MNRVHSFDSILLIRVGFMTQLAKVSCNGDYVIDDAKNINCLRALTAINEVSHLYKIIS